MANDCRGRRPQFRQRSRILLLLHLRHDLLAANGSHPSLLSPRHQHDFDRRVDVTDSARRRVIGSLGSQAGIARRQRRVVRHVLAAVMDDAPSELPGHPPRSAWFCCINCDFQRCWPSCYGRNSAQPGALHSRLGGAQSRLRCRRRPHADDRHLHDKAKRR